MYRDDQLGNEEIDFFLILFFICSRLGWAAAAGLSGIPDIRLGLLQGGGELVHTHTTLLSFSRRDFQLATTDGMSIHAT
jgi:hypothetical protein